MSSRGLGGSDGWGDSATQLRVKQEDDDWDFSDGASKSSATGAAHGFRGSHSPTTQDNGNTSTNDPEFAPQTSEPTGSPENPVAPEEYKAEETPAKTEAQVAAGKVTKSIEPPSGGWSHSAARYEWDDAYGDVAPRHEELEKLLFGDTSSKPAGLDFSSLCEIPVTQESEKHVEYIDKFEDAGLHPVMMDNVALCGYELPTPIQRYCIPAILQGYDMLACAQTGSGKTAAFLIPILSKLMGKAKQLSCPRPALGMTQYKAEPLVLIVAPTRELATQIFDESRRFCYRSMLRPCVVYGGADMRTQRLELGKGCDVLIGTPGRLADFLERGVSLSLKRVKYTVVDEADEMLDMGFEPQLRNILLRGDFNANDDLQISMFSATFPKTVRKLARDFLASDHIFIKVGRVGSTHPNITQRVFWVDEDKKRDAIYDLLISAPPARTLIFVANKRAADDLDDYLFSLNLPTTSIHGERTQREREDAIRAFRSGKCPILVATDVASRGLDIKNVMHVINYDLPLKIDEYIHRIGRTARIGNRGLATSFYNERNEPLAPQLVKILLEAKQEVPEILQQYIPPDGQINFDERGSEVEEEENGGLPATTSSSKPTSEVDWNDAAASASSWDLAGAVTQGVAGVSLDDW